MKRGGGKNMLLCRTTMKMRRKGEVGLNRRAFKVTTVCYPTCCDHVIRRIEGIMGRSCLTLPVRLVSHLCLFSDGGGIG